MYVNRHLHELDLDDLDRDEDRATGVAPGKVTLTSRLPPRAPRTLAELERRLGPGAPLPSALATRMSGAVGADVSIARLHHGEDAAALARAAGALAFTIGPHVVLGDGVALGSEAGERVLAHELVHVVQQRGGAVGVGAGPVGDEDAGDERAAETLATAAQVRLAGGSAAEVAGPSSTPGLRLQRATEVPAAAAPTSPWPGGPSPGAVRKSASVHLADYVGWLREVERAYGSGPATLQRLRRLYYSVGSGAVGSKFDQLLDTDHELRLTAPPMAPAVLDRLYETDTVVTSSGVTDPSHILGLLDLDHNGTSPTGRAAGAVAPLAGLITWTGDLASWFVQWYVEHRERLDTVDGGVAADEEIPLADQLQHLRQVRDSKVSKEDLIGNLDAHAFELDEVGRPPGQASIATAFERYFAHGAPRRFHLFVHNARPAIPHELVAHNPVQVALAASAEQAIYDHLWWAVAALRQSPIAPIAGHRPILEHIAATFAGFLRTGLATGDAPW